MQFKKEKSISSKNVPDKARKMTKFIKSQSLSMYLYIFSKFYVINGKSVLSISLNE